MNDQIMIIWILGVVLTLIILAWRTQNRLAPLRERVTEAESNVKTAIQKRNRLIKQLMDIAVAYATHEKTIHERVSADFSTPEKIAMNPNGALTYISRLANSFPELRADRTYLDLTNKLYALESELQEKHHLHSASVREYNSVRLSFPHNFFGGFVLKFQIATHLDTDEALPIETEKKNKILVINQPRVGMRFVDESDGALFEIEGFGEDGTILSFEIPESGSTTHRKRGSNPQSWSERVADGRIRIL